MKHLLHLLHHYMQFSYYIVLDLVFRIFILTRCYMVPGVFRVTLVLKALRVDREILV